MASLSTTAGSVVLGRRTITSTSWMGNIASPWCAAAPPVTVMLVQQSSIILVIMWATATWWSIKREDGSTGRSFSLMAKPVSEALLRNVIGLTARNEMSKADYIISGHAIICPTPLDGQVPIQSEL